jgi:YVTN family beta-propeller protein
MDTLVLTNNTLVPGNFAPYLGAPAGLAADPVSGTLYAADPPYDLAVINGSTGALANVDPVGPSPLAVTVDSATGNVWVAVGNFSGGAVEINSTTGAYMASGAVGGYGVDLLYDPVTGYVYVANYLSGDLTVLNASSGAVVGQLPTGLGPSAIALDPVRDYLFVANRISGNVTVLNATTGSVLGSVAVGGAPNALAYDGATGELFVVASSLPGSNVTIVDTATDSVVGILNVTGGLADAAFDAATGVVYVADPTLGTAVEIDAATGQLAGAIGVGPDPLGVAYDAPNGRVYVGNAVGSDNITVIDGSTGATVGSIPLAEDPQGIAYDSANGEMFVADDYLGALAVNDTSNQVAGAFPLAGGSSTEAWLVAVDPASDRVYVATTTGANGSVTALDGSSGAVLGSFGVADPGGLATDPTSARVYVTSDSSNAVEVFDGSTLTELASIPVGSDPQGIAYDRSNGYLYVANDDSTNLNGTSSGVANVTVLDPATGRAVASIPVGLVPGGVVYDPQNGYVYVANELSNNVTVIDPASQSAIASIPVGEVGISLAGGNEIAVSPSTGLLYVANEGSDNVTVINGSTNSVVGSVPVGMGPVGVAVDPATGLVYVTNQGSGTISIISPTAGAFYPVYFYETGLPGGTLWKVMLGAAGTSGTTVGSTGGYLWFSEPNGTYHWWLVDVSLPEIATPSNASVTVAGNALYIGIQFVPYGFPLWFNESGLASGTTWSVAVQGTGAYPEYLTNSSPTASIEFTVPTGFTAYFWVGAVAGYRATPSGGNLTTPGLVGGPTTVTVVFSPVEYAVAFQESGLPNGTSWTVSLEGTGGSAPGPTIYFLAANGSYPYTIGTVPGYTSDPANGTVRVSGAPVQVAVTFTAGGAGPLRILSFLVTPSTLSVGATVSVLVTTSGGIGPLTYRYSGFPAGCSMPDLASWSCRPAATGGATVEVRVTDASGASVAAEDQLTVGATGPSGSPLPLSFTFGIGLGLLAVLIIVSALVLRARTPPPGTRAKDSGRRNPYRSAARAPPAPRRDPPNVPAGPGGDRPGAEDPLSHLV